MQKLFLICFLALSACAPINYVYVKKLTDTSLVIDNVIIMVEYLDVKQSFGQYWKFDELANLIQQDYLYQIAVTILEEKGYQISSSFLKTSGLITDRNFRVKHYVRKKAMPELITPPFIIRSVNLNDENIRSLENLLAALNRPMSAVMAELRGYVVNNYQQQMKDIEIPENTGLLILQTYKPRYNIFADVDVGYTGGLFDSSVAIGSRSLSSATTYGYFLYKGTGELLWSNKISLINDKTQEKFFLDLPQNHSDYQSE